MAIRTSASHTKSTGLARGSAGGVLAGGSGDGMGHCVASQLNPPFALEASRRARNLSTTSAATLPSIDFAGGAAAVFAAPESQEQVGPDGDAADRATAIPRDA